MKKDILLKLYYFRLTFFIKKNKIPPKLVLFKQKQTLFFMKKIYFTFLLLASSSFLFAQDSEVDQDLIFDDHVYVDYIESVKLHIPGVVVSYPIINLGRGSLTLTFDDLEGDSRDYIYSIVHCDADWTPSDLSEMEYVGGFNEERIPAGEFSFNTLTNYTNYSVTFPNEDIRITKSGNYLLKVYDDEDDRFLVLTRRFMVVEPSFSVRGVAFPSSVVSKNRTHQEIDFSVVHKGIDINNPRKEVKVTVLQNGRWDTAIENIPPQYIKGVEIKYEFNDRIVFPASKEFRYVDLRTLQYRTDQVRGIEEYKDGYDVTLYMDKVRAYSVYQDLRDINGGFVIGNIDNNDGVNVSFSDTDSEEARANKLAALRRQMNLYAESNNLESDYANVLFSLEMNEPFYDKDVYIFGGLTDWKVKEHFKMTYQDVVNAYVADVFLKQGFYNYMYVTVPKKGAKVPDMEELEGNWFETENDYTILVYFRPFGERYDRLMAAYTIDSSRR